MIHYQLESLEFELDHYSDEHSDYRKTTRKYSLAVLYPNLECMQSFISLLIVSVLLNLEKKWDGLLDIRPVDY